MTPLFGIEPATPTTSECTREAEVARIGGGGGVATVGPALVVMVAEAKGVSGRICSCQLPRRSSEMVPGPMCTDEVVAGAVGVDLPGKGQLPAS